MKFSDIPIGTKLELEVFDGSGEKMQPLFVSEFEWLEENETVCIAAPIHEGVLYPLHIGNTMNVYFYHKINLYMFKAVLTERDMKDNLAFLKIKILSDIERIQRREFFRFTWSTPVKFKAIDSMNDRYNAAIPFQETLTKDLSGGGICILLEEKLELNQLIECELLLEDKYPVRFIGKTIRVSRLDSEGRFKYEAGILFKKIENRDREAIIGSIFKEQRKLRKKGLI